MSGHCITTMFSVFEDIYERNDLCTTENCCILSLLFLLVHLIQAMIFVINFLSQHGILRPFGAGFTMAVMSFYSNIPMPCS